MIDGSFDTNALLPQRCDGCLDIRFRDQKGKVLCGPGSFVFLEQHHAGLTTSPQE